MMINNRVSECTVVLRFNTGNGTEVSKFVETILKKNLGNECTTCSEDQFSGSEKGRNTTCSLFLFSQEVSAETLLKNRRVF